MNITTLSVIYTSIAGVHSALRGAWRTRRRWTVDHTAEQLKEPTMNAINNSELPRSVFRKEQNQLHSMQGNHITGVATPTSRAQQREMWFGRMDANSPTPPHSPATQEVVLFLKGSG